MNRTLHLSLFAIMCAAQLGMCGYLIQRWESVLKRGQSYKFKTQAMDPYDPFRGRFVTIQLEKDYVVSEKPVDASQLMNGQAVYVTLATDPDGYSRFASCDTKPPEGAVPYFKAKVSYVDNSRSIRPGDLKNPLSLAQQIQTSPDVISVFIREKIMDYESKTLEKSIETGKLDPSLVNTLCGLLNRVMQDQTLAVRLFGKENTPNVYMNPEIIRMEFDKAYPDMILPSPAARIFVNHPFDRFYMEESQAPRAEVASWQHSRAGEDQRTHITVRVKDGYGVIENLWIGDKSMSDYLKSRP